MLVIALCGLLIIPRVTWDAVSIILVFIVFVASICLLVFGTRIENRSFVELQIVQIATLLHQSGFLLFAIPFFVQETLFCSRTADRKKIIFLIIKAVALLTVIGFCLPIGFVAMLTALAPHYLIGTLFFFVLARQKQRMIIPQEELHQRLARQDELLSTLTHEIRTPLTVIQSSAEILQQGRLGVLNNHQKSFLDSLLDNIKRLIAFSDSILSSIKVETDWFALNLTSLDLRGVVRDAITSMNPYVLEKGIEFRTGFPSLLARPPGDRNWIYQVLINLIHNAVKHLPNGGEIFITVQENESYSIISVSDNGEGIPLTQRQKLFSEFSQGSIEKELDNEGAGLGLAIVRKVVEKHDGRVYLSSIADGGTTVSFTLPLKPIKAPNG